MAAGSGSGAQAVQGFPEVNNGDLAYIEPRPQFRRIQSGAETAKLFQMVTERT